MPLESLHRVPGDTPHIETNLAPGELITGFRLPVAAWTRRSMYLKIRDRQSYEVFPDLRHIGACTSPAEIVRKRLLSRSAASLPSRGGRTRPRRP